MFGARKTFIALAGAAIVSAFATGAQAESPFHTGVWQVNTAEGPQGLVVSDWLIFDDGLPSRWIYRRSGANDQNQFDFYVRTMGQPIFVDGSVRVYRTGENAMKYTVFLRGQQPVENPSIRLSQPNYIKSCLSVENKGERLFGAWRGTKKSSFKRIRLSKNKLTIDGKSENVEIKPVRVGRLGILKDGQPIAFFTDAGGDYAVLQRFKSGVTVAQMTDPRREILDFASEEIVRDPRGTCDRQIKSRLKLLGKVK